MVPALIYMFRVPTAVVVGTSLFQILFTMVAADAAACGHQPVGGHHPGDPARRRRRVRRAVRRAGGAEHQGRAVPAAARHASSSPSGSASPPRSSSVPTSGSRWARWSSAGGRRAAQGMRQSQYPGPPCAGIRRAGLLSVDLGAGRIARRDDDPVAVHTGRITQPIPGRSWCLRRHRARPAQRRPARPGRRGRHVRGPRGHRRAREGALRPDLDEPQPAQILRRPHHPGRALDAALDDMASPISSPATGWASIMRAPASRRRAGTPPSVDALIRLKRESGLYLENPKGVTFLSSSAYSARPCPSAGPRPSAITRSTMSLLSSGVELARRQTASR